jgi:hypothetical protein
MTTKSILKHPYWLPPENENDNPHYEQFCNMAMRAFTRWREDAYAVGVISADEYKTYLNRGVDDIPGSSTVIISADHTEEWLSAAREWFERTRWSPRVMTTAFQGTPDAENRHEKVRFPLPLVDPLEYHPNRH